jgi:hypothetical protein
VIQPVGSSQVDLMTSNTLLAPLRSLQTRIAAIEQVMSRRTSMLIFLVIRFVLMSAMVVGFTWYSLKLSP